MQTSLKQELMNIQPKIISNRSLGETSKLQSPTGRQSKGAEIFFGESSRCAKSLSQKAPLSVCPSTMETVHTSPRECTSSQPVPIVPRKNISPKPPGQSPPNFEKKTVISTPDNSEHLESHNPRSVVEMSIDDLFKDPCSVCLKTDEKPGNGMLECSDCRQFFHQLCHKPPAVSVDPLDPRLVWNCVLCQNGISVHPASLKSVREPPTPSDTPEPTASANMVTEDERTAGLPPVKRSQKEPESSASKRKKSVQKDAPGDQPDQSMSTPVVADNPNLSITTLPPDVPTVDSHMHAAGGWVAEGAIAYTVPNVQELLQSPVPLPEFSSPVMIGRMPWRIVVKWVNFGTPQCPSLSFFLQCEQGGKDRPNLLGAEVEATFRLVPHNPETPIIVRAISQSMYTKRRDLGFQKFISFEDLLDQARGYAAPDYSLRLEADIKVKSRAQGANVDERSTVTRSGSESGGMARMKGSGATPRSTKKVKSKSDSKLNKRPSSVLKASPIGSKIGQLRAFFQSEADRSLQMKSLVENVETELGGKRVKIIALQKDASRLKRKVAELETFKKRSQELETEANLHKKQLEDKDRQIAELEPFKQLSEDLETEMNVHQIRCKEKDNKIRQLEDELSTQRSVVKELLGRIGNLEQQVKENENTQMEQFQQLKQKLMNSFESTCSGFLTKPGS